MFFKRKKKDEVAERPSEPRFVDVRVTAIEPQNFDIRHTMEVGDEEDELEGRVDVQAAPRSEPVPDAVDGPAQLFRPRYRPPMMILKIMDDNQKTSELVRVRGEKCVLGRDEGDIIIPHDKLMSGRHAEIVRRFEDEDYAWHLCDLKSRNGTFVKVDFIRLREGDELVLGSATFSFQEPRGSYARLVEVGSQPRQIKFEKEDFWIGRDRKRCAAALVNDQFLGQKHARIHQSKGRWCVTAASTRNGVWARVDRVRLNNGTKFLLGEQRFQLLVP